MCATPLCPRFLSVYPDSKQNGDANVALSEEGGCSLTQPLSPSEKWTLRRSRARDKTKKEAACFLLTSGDFSCVTETAVLTGTGKGESDV